MSGRRFPLSIALALMAGGALGPDKQREEAEDEMPRNQAGQSKYTAEIVRLWAEGLTPAQIGKRIGMKNMATIRRVLMSNGVSEAEIDARRIRPRGTKGSRALLAPIEDPRITDFDPVDAEEEAGEEPEQTAAGPPGAPEEVAGITHNSASDVNYAATIPELSDAELLYCLAKETRASGRVQFKREARRRLRQRASGEVLDLHPEWTAKLRAALNEESGPEEATGGEHPFRPTAVGE
ncbi:MAG: hypothetical protein QME79_14165 [Bacillota bacterium]|nr:hypothetical protein [Bacillota bacterium]